MHALVSDRTALKPWFHVKTKLFLKIHARAAAIRRPSYILFQAWFRYKMK